MAAETAVRSAREAAMAARWRMSASRRPAIVARSAPQELAARRW